MMSSATDWRKFLTGKVHPDNSRELLIQTSYGNSAGKLWGPLDGEPVIALHGWQDCCSSFDRLIPLLPKNLLIIAMDLLGHGHSDHHPARVMYNSVTYLMWLKELIDILSLETFTMLAHSLSVSMFLPFVTILQPHRVKMVITLDLVYPFILNKFESFPNFLESMETYEKQEASKNPKPVERDTAIRKMTSTRPSLDRGSAECLMERACRNSGEGKVTFTRDPRLTLFLLLSYRYHSFGSVEEMMRRFRGRWLMIVTTDSEYAPYLEREKIDRVKVALGTNSVKYEVFETYGGHYVHLVHPERIAPKITAFIRGGLNPSRL